MDLEKKYYGALERARELSKSVTGANYEYIFPELRESEDERIRKALIDYFDDAIKADENPLHGIQTHEVINWLERQGEKKPYEWHSEDEQNLNATLSYIDDEYLRRWLKDIIHAKYEQCGGCVNDKGCVTCVDDNMKEQKVEPKFKAGDWIIDNVGNIFQIVKVLDNTYAYKTNEGKEYSCTHYSLENDAKLWTIQDARNGDVLANDHHILILKESVYDWYTNGTPYSVKAYCGIKPNGNFEIGKDNWSFCGTIHIHPATKEQCDLLFAKMRESGYEWDNEEKELKKMEVADKESEDESIRKEILNVFKQLDEGTTICGRNYDYAKWIAWLEKQGNVDEASYEIAEKEKYDFVSGQFIECRKSFNEFKENNSYWFEYVGNDTYIGRSDNVLNKKFHITPMQLYRLFTQQHRPKENDVNEETNAPTGYGKYVDECLYEAAEHFFSEGEDKYSVADLFYAGVRCGKSCLEKQSEQKQTWKPTAAQLIVIKNLIEDKNTSKVNKTILRGMFDEFKQITNGHKREIDDAYLQGICDAKHEIEKQGKQTHVELGQSEMTKTSDQELEPKFHAGEWIISNNTKSTYQVIEVMRGFYAIRDNADNHEYYIGIEECEKSGRLWCISDAKDGDVLVCPSDLGDRMVVFIFKQLVNNASEIDCHCCIDANGIFDPCLNDCCYVGDVSRADYIPATKEQRDLLFQKMTESGYEWDNEKKELKKTEVSSKEKEDER